MRLWEKLVRKSHRNVYWIHNQLKKRRTRKNITMISIVRKRASFDHVIHSWSTPRRATALGCSQSCMQLWYDSYCVSGQVFKRRVPRRTTTGNGDEDGTKRCAVQTRVCTTGEGQRSSPGASTMWQQWLAVSNRPSVQSMVRPTSLSSLSVSVTHAYLNEALPSNDASFSNFSIVLWWSVK
jgi:hypothetical protein